MSILYPVAETAEAALHAPRGTAARAREARALAGDAVAFETRLVGPGYASREAALDAYAGRVDDDRPGRAFATPAEARWCELRALSEAAKPARPVKPAFKDGRRWPAPPAEAPRTVWRLSVSFWRIVGDEALPELPAARRVRRGAGGGEAAMDSRALRALAAQPLRAYEPQRPLDIGLFEVRLPEQPDMIIPDE